MKWLVSFALMIVVGIMTTIAVSWNARSDQLRWSVLTNYHYPVSDLPETAGFGDIIAIGQDGELSDFDPLQVCDISNSFQLQENPTDLVEVRTRPTVNPLIGDKTEFRQLNPIGFVDSLRLADEGCERTIVNEANGACLVLVGSEMRVDGDLVGLSTSTSCLLFDYENMSEDEIQELTRARNFAGLFGVTRIERYLLALHSLL